jgi:CspA family cold shock protein
MYPGTVRFYYKSRGYGFIAPSYGGNDIFIHAAALERAGIRKLIEGQKVTFDTRLDHRSGRSVVENICTGR